MENHKQILNKLMQSECKENKCPYCWGTTVRKNEDNFCEECKIKVDDWCELI